MTIFVKTKIVLFRARDRDLRLFVAFYPFFATKKGPFQGPFSWQKSESKAEVRFLPWKSRKIFADFSKPRKSRKISKNFSKPLKIGPSSMPEGSGKILFLFPKFWKLRDLESLDPSKSLICPYFWPLQKCAPSLRWKSNFHFDPNLLPTVAIQP